MNLKKEEISFINGEDLVVLTPVNIQSKDISDWKRETQEHIKNARAYKVLSSVHDEISFSVTTHYAIVNLLTFNRNQNTREDYINCYGSFEARELNDLLLKNHDLKNYAYRNKESSWMSIMAKLRGIPEVIRHNESHPFMNDEVRNEIYSLSKEWTIVKRKRKERIKKARKALDTLIVWSKSVFFYRDIEALREALEIHMGEVPSVDKVFDVLELTPDEKSFIEVLTAVKSMSSKPLSQLTIDEIASVLASREPLPDEEINRAELTKEFIDLIAHMNSAKVRTIKLEDLEGSE